MDNSIVNIPSSSTTTAYRPGVGSENRERRISKRLILLSLRLGSGLSLLIRWAGELLPEECKRLLVSEGLRGLGLERLEGLTGLGSLIWKTLERLVLERSGLLILEESILIVCKSWLLNRGGGRRKDGSGSIY